MHTPAATVAIGRWGDCTLLVCTRLRERGARVRLARRVLAVESDAELALRLERARLYVELGEKGARHFLVLAQVTLATVDLECAYRAARVEASVMRYVIGRPDPDEPELTGG